MQLKSQITVLAARRYSMTDEKTGELIQGVKITYVDSWGGSFNQNDSGVAVLSATLPIESFNQFAKLPALFDASFELVSGARGKATLRLATYQYAQPFEPFSRPTAK